MLHDHAADGLERAGDAVGVPPLSYAQNMEDYHLSLAFAGAERGIYVDIGGGHPIAGSASFWFYERGWQGVVVEPQEDLVSPHRRLRPRDTTVRAAIGREIGETDLYCVERLHALSTTVIQHAQAASRYGAGFRRVRVPALSLAELCRSRDLDDIDFLKVDVEGAERDVIAGGDWQRYRPKVIIAKAIAPTTGEPTWEAWEPLLLANGYRFALFDTLNRFYVAEEHPEVLARMPSERAPWDRVRHMYEIGRAPENAGHPDHQLARALTRGFWASLPYLDDALLSSLLRRDRDTDGLDREVGTESFRRSLGRIACGYDGGQITEE